MEKTTKERILWPVMWGISDEERELYKDFPVFARAVLRIQTTEGRLAPLVLNEIQELLEEIVADIRASGRPVRLIILKARREGISTWAAGRLYWKTATNFNRAAVIIAHEREATDFLFGMVKRFQRHVPNGCKPAELHNNSQNLEFNRPSGNGLDSAIRVGTANKTDFGSGQLIHYILLSETAKWPTQKASQLLTSVLQCVPDDEDTEVIFESTAKGPAGEFYERFFRARYFYEVFLNNKGQPQYRMKINESGSRENLYSAVFIPWYVFKKYKLTDKCAGVTDDEFALKKLYGITNSHLLWRRKAIENRCGGSLDVFRQEYPSNAREAFVSKQSSIFDIKKITQMKAAAPPPIARREFAFGTMKWTDAAEGRLMIWEEPGHGLTYVIGADVAEGLQSGDFSCAFVVERLTGRQAAIWHGHMDADLFGALLINLGRYYNTAWLTPERNNHGLTTILKIVEQRYPRIYVEMIAEPPAKSRKRFGWLTNASNKHLIIDNLVSEIRDGTSGIVSVETFDEMLTFVQTEDGKYGADAGAHDDRVMAAAIAKHVRKTLPLPSKTPLRTTPTKPNEDAWT
ncbi:hypothetical protein [Candidatus Magnetominusculus xianensis]|uniref:Large terminase protein n=1 Tax=Candidatus Magnetominusculus xianensis TaxID=1748249 RepID=A0ABR5SFX9_9BACT|nr:hypothetical protein [Candidatus Magnetominusculus xianensis]KWT86922.1 large terminase protein [Candidatus Magnetominusculus xianensis]MBF0403953.1 hypothetical protein [Nitrospirota bacterium]